MTASVMTETYSRLNIYAKYLQEEDWEEQATDGRRWTA
jgi:hypothetical protein